MATMRPLLLAAVVGIAAASAFQPAAAQERGYLSITVGTPGPYYGYHHHRPGYVWVPGHWMATHHGRVWVPEQYVPLHVYRHHKGRHKHRGYGYDDYRYGYGRGDGYGGYGYGGYGGARIIYRAGPGVVPRPYYPPGYLSPHGDWRRPDW